VVANLAVNEVNLDHIREAGGIESLASILRTPDLPDSVRAFSLYNPPSISLSLSLSIYFCYIGTCTFHCSLSVPAASTEDGVGDLELACERREPGPLRSDRRLRPPSSLPGRQGSRPPSYLSRAQLSQKYRKISDARAHLPQNNKVQIRTAAAIVNATQASDSIRGEIGRMCVPCRLPPPPRNFPAVDPSTGAVSGR
jgi:hypothetical protein